MTTIPAPMQAADQGRSGRYGWSYQGLGTWQAAPVVAM